MAGLVAPHSLIWEETTPNCTAPLRLVMETKQVTSFRRTNSKTARQTFGVNRVSS
jgi:hypothetical protein